MQSYAHVLVVTDISIPWMSGLWAIRSTRAAGLATSVIVMMALTDERIPAQVRMAVFPAVKLWSCTCSR